MSDQNTTVAQAWRQIFVSLDTLALAHENAGTSFTGPVSSVRAAIRPLHPPLRTFPSAIAWSHVCV